MEKTKQHAQKVIEACRLVSQVMQDLVDTSTEDVTPDQVEEILTKHRESIDKDIMVDVLYLGSQFLAEGAKLKTYGVEEMNKRVIEDKNAVSFPLIVDRDRCNILHMAFAAIDLKIPDFYTVLTEEGILREYEELANEITDKEHALGWCPDPTCTYGKE